MDKEELYGEDRLAAETRIRNLLWTVSGDYDLSCELDIDSFQKAKEISLYDAIKQGAFARFFDTEAFGLYLVKKIYLGAEEGQLMGISQLCLDEASFSQVAAERPGVPDIRKRAFEEILERDFGRLNASFAGRLKLAYLRRTLTGDPAGEQKLRRELELMKEKTIKERIYDHVHVSVRTMDIFIGMMVVLFVVVVVMGMLNK